MKFENKGKWFMESEDTDKDMLNDEQQELAMEDDAGDLLAEDDLNLADEDIDDDSEGIFNDEEQVDGACKQRNESWSDLYPVVAEIGEDWEFYKKKPKYTRNELKQAAITKLKAKGKSFNSQDLEEALNRWYTSESAQKNETTLFKDTEMIFDNIGGGIVCYFDSNKYGQKRLDISIGLISMTSKGNYTKTYDTMSNAEAEKQQEIDKPKILKELKVLADNLDKNVKTLLAKYGYTLSK